MASDEARCRQGASDGEQYADNVLHTPEEGPVSGILPRPPWSSSAFTCVDEDTETDKVGDPGEPTRITPGALIETLRQASRADQLPDEIANDEISAPPPPRYDVGDEDETLPFPAQASVPAPRARWRRSVPLLASAVVALALLFAMRVGQPVPKSPAVRVEPAPTQHAGARESAEPVAQNAAALSVVEPSPVIQVEPMLVDDALPAPDAGDADPPLAAHDSLDVKHKWLRALARGRQQAASQEYDGALFSFGRAIEYNPRDAEGYAGLGAVQLARGKSREALKAFRRAVALAPAKAAFRAGLGQAYEQSGNPSRAASAYRRALKLDPSLASAKDGLARLPPDPPN